jgi:hypothetical protein
MIGARHRRCARDHDHEPRQLEHDESSDAQHQGVPTLVKRRIDLAAPRGLLEATHPGGDMVASVELAPREDPSTSNLRGWLLLFFVLQLLAIPYNAYFCAKEFAFAHESYLHPGVVTYHRIHAMYSGALTVASAIGLLLIVVRDPRTRVWWITESSIFLLMAASEVWLEHNLLGTSRTPTMWILLRHGFFPGAVWLAYWTFSSRVKIAFGPLYSQPPVSSNVLGAVAAVATLIVGLLAIAGSLT